MADPVITDPVLLAALAVLSAQDDRPDAPARGDAAAVALATAGLWTATQFEGYKKLAAAEKAKGWKSGIWVKDLQKPDDFTVAGIIALYASLYPTDGQAPGFLEIPWAVLKGAAVMSAQQGDPKAVQQGDNAAQSMAWAGVWTVSDYGKYLQLSDAQKMAFWAAGGDRAKLDAAKSGGLNKPNQPVPGDSPAPGGSSSTVLYVVGGIAGLWILSKMFGGKR